MLGLEELYWEHQPLLSRERVEEALTVVENVHDHQTGHHNDVDLEGCLAAECLNLFRVKALQRCRHIGRGMSRSPSLLWAQFFVMAILVNERALVLSRHVGGSGGFCLEVLK